jgi:chromosome segregation ATPase
MLVPFVLALGPCVDEEALRAAQQRLDERIAATVPKAELWNEIERRGRALEETRAVEAEAARVAARIEALRAEVAAQEAGLAQLDERAERHDAALARARDDLAAARAEIERRRAILDAFATRRRAAEALP